MGAYDFVRSYDSNPYRKHFPRDICRLTLLEQSVVGRVGQDLAARLARMTIGDVHQPLYAYDVRVQRSPSTKEAWTLNLEGRGSDHSDTAILSNNNNGFWYVPRRNRAFVAFNCLMQLGPGRHNTTLFLVGPQLPSTASQGDTWCFSGDSRNEHAYPGVVEKDRWLLRFFFVREPWAADSTLRQIYAEGMLWETKQHLLESVDSCYSSKSAELCSEAYLATECHTGVGSSALDKPVHDEFSGGRNWLANVAAAWDYGDGACKEIVNAPPFCSGAWGHASPSGQDLMLCLHGITGLSSTPCYPDLLAWAVNRSRLHARGGGAPLPKGAEAFNASCVQRCVELLRHATGRCCTEFASMLGVPAIRMHPTSLPGRYD